MRASTGHAVTDSAQEQREDRERDVAGRIDGIQTERQRRAEEERRDDARVRDRDRRVRVSAQELRVELEPDEEHEQHDADLRHDAQVRRHRRRHDELVRGRRDQAEQRGPEHEPGHDLTDHRRLLQVAPEHAAHEARQQRDDGQREQEVRQHRRVRGFARPARARRRLWGDERLSVRADEEVDPDGGRDHQAVSGDRAQPRRRG
jgi:hypothetical protein